MDKINKTKNCKLINESNNKLLNSLLDMKKNI